MVTPEAQSMFIKATKPYLFGRPTKKHGYKHSTQVEFLTFWALNSTLTEKLAISTFTVLDKSLRSYIMHFQNLTPSEQPFYSHSDWLTKTVKLIFCHVLCFLDIKSPAVLGIQLSAVSGTDIHLLSVSVVVVRKACLHQNNYLHPCQRKGENIYIFLCKKTSLFFDSSECTSEFNFKTLIQQGLSSWL